MLGTPLGPSYDGTMRSPIRFLIAFAAAGLTGCGCPFGDDAPKPNTLSALRSSASSARLAERIENLPGLENVGLVAPGIYRGAEPAEEGFGSLKKLGVKTIVNLRHFHHANEEEACRKLGIENIWIALATSEAPSDDDVRKFLSIVTDPAKQPVYFHCMRGKDRTGTMCAAYRMAVEGWPLEDALREMDAFGFSPIWRSLRNYVKGFPERKASIWPKTAPVEATH